MKASFQNLDIQCWEHAGSRLGTSKPEICLQAGPEAIAAMLMAVAELEKEGPPAKRTLTFRRNQRGKQCSTLRILLSASDDDLRQMSIGRQGSTATFEFTPAGLREFRDAVIGWWNGGQDFGVCPQWTNRRRKKEEMGSKDLASGEVWFWTPDMDP
jgi:hypothetical protein